MFTATLPPVFQAIASACFSVLLIAGVWTVAQYLLAWWYHEDLGDHSFSNR